MLQLIFLLDDFIDVILAIKIPPEFSDLSLIFLNPNFLIFELFFELNNPLVFLDLCNHLFLLLTISFFLGDLVHLASQFF